MRVIFLTVVSIGTLLIMLGMAYLPLRLWGVPQKKRWFWSLLGIEIVAVFGAAYYQIAQGHLYHGEWYGFWSDWTIEVYGYMIGAAVAVVLMAVLVGYGWLWCRFCKPTKMASTGATDDPRETIIADDGVANPSRRAFLKGAAIAIPAITIGGASVKAFEGAQNLVVTHHDLLFDSLPMYLKNYRIAQISDVHIGPFIDLHDFDEIAERVLAEHPDRLVITGDLIDNLDFLPGLCERLEALFPKIPDGIDYILGNHEYFHNVPLILESFGALSMRVFRNSSLRLSGGSWPVYLAGVDYSFARSQAQRESYLEAALEGVLQEAFVVLLAHHPDFIGDAFKRNIPVTLSGHTHGGQINVADNSLVPVGTPYWKGMYRDGNNYGYVNNGTGHWFPVRMNCPREISVFRFLER